MSTDSSSIVLWQRGVTVVAQPWRYTALRQQDAGCCKTSHWLTRSKQDRVAAQSLTAAAPSERPHMLDLLGFNSWPTRANHTAGMACTAVTDLSEAMTPQGGSAAYCSSSALVD